MPVVVVESPAKAKTINKYLGPGYTVLASYGHVRDLPPKDGSVDPEHEFSMKWEVGNDSRKHVKAIADALKEDNALILATDPDREGEAISWHLQEALTKRRSIKKDTPVSRVTFNAITKEAVTQAMQNPREVDMPLVEAYLARRALDYLVGFNLSPVLWRKLPGAKSAGRVQSVCLRLIVEREMEIEAFKPVEYWSVKALFETPRGQTYETRLVTLAGKKLDKHDLANATQAELAVQAITSRALSVTSVEAKPAARNPSAPFMTSTLQQEASRKFGMGARHAMQVAQRLYEAGYITYMRTDGIDMAPEAVAATRDTIADRYGAEYVPDSPRMYKNKAKNAQEAHECIRPTDMSRDAKALKVTDEDQRKLYDLIWKRTIACQMAAARLERTTVEIGSDDGQVGLRATGQVVLFDGFMRVYEEGRDDVADDDEKRLPQIMQGDPARFAKTSLKDQFAKAEEKAAILSENESVLALQHHTQPPPRYTEATLVKRMEELGIGRPSTYASIVTTIQDREYVRKDKNRLIPEEKGRIVTIFLLNFFRQYVGYEFTANLEEELDDVSAGDRDYKDLLGKFWRDFSAAIGETSELRISEVLDKLDEALAPQLYPPREDGSDPRICPKCGTGQLHLKTSRTGGFVGCGNYPECTYTRPIAGEGAEGDERLLGEDAGDEIWLKSGRFGPYVQRGEPTPENKKPPRASLPRGWSKDDMDLDKALTLLSLPRQIGEHPEGGMISSNFGRFGPYLMHQLPEEAKPVYANLKDPNDVFEIGMNRAVELLAEKRANPGRGRRAAAKPLKDLGEHPDGGAMQVLDGRYGPYVKWEKVNATIPKDIKPEDVTQEMAIELVNERAAKKGTKKKAAPKKKAAAKKTTKKAAE
ncbi:MULTISPECIES: type I DNA topoisomerase [unclassified Ruegeria]|uniref:type I DNA topoisomerase n=1 Tax=unclassified Ruegeria TaxID=2625375 RepID=UPI0014889401|nr:MULTISPECIES: type I DNA topoisomerase [unclassified Ruegeria]NOD77091.1 type I DNA topoisomerase [Ruegeria sp. HKCCD4332]NOD89562.1 type I DNA topoisomerase [Ruegeria sp. HKCCD4318]NOE13885.1 type I DNA topoisomerase [Ruegeria sp. HKCCD4318-2]NOG08178.1 type I DNA topoisomerase [Ruegeria sp. HKCCD4315]